MNMIFVFYENVNFNDAKEAIILDGVGNKTFIIANFIWAEHSCRYGLLKMWVTISSNCVVN